MIQLLACIFVFYCFWVKSVFFRQRRHVTNAIQNLLNMEPVSSVRALIIIAEPGQETTIFGPTIMRLIDMGAVVHLMCFPGGNYRNQGAQRKVELRRSTAELGVCTTVLIDHRNITDNPNDRWNLELVAFTILKYIRSHSMNLVLTFDGQGVSGHINHVSIYQGLKYNTNEQNLPQGCVLLSLVTVNCFRKYISFLDIPMSWIHRPTLMCVASLSGYQRIKAAMMCHRSQLVWYRRLYVFFSRYMFVNTYELIPLGPDN